MAHLKSAPHAFASTAYQDSEDFCGSSRSGLASARAHNKALRQAVFPDYDPAEPVFIGTIRLFHGQRRAVEGLGWQDGQVWVECSGQRMVVRSRQTLHALLGVPFTEDDLGIGFNLPDLRQRDVKGRAINWPERGPILILCVEGPPPPAQAG